MNKSRSTRMIRRTEIAAVLAAAIVASGGGYAVASSHGTGRTASRDHDSLRYLVGSDVLVPADSAGSNATKCPKGMYPVGGGPSSPEAVWQIQWSNADRSTASARHPNEWAVSLFNDSNNSAVFKVFVVCSSANSVSSNY
jgi:hypothetical protein